MRGLRKSIAIGSLAIVIGGTVFVLTPVSVNPAHSPVDSGVGKHVSVNKPIIHQDIQGDDKHQAAAERLKKTGDKYLDMIMNDEEGDGFTNHVMAEINYRAYLSFELTDSLRTGYEEKLRITKTNDNYSIFSGISTNGVMFIAIAYPQINSESYEESINTISGNKNEFQLLNRFLEPPGLKDNIYYAVDLYVEDLIGDKQEFEVELWEPSVGAVDYPVKHSESDVNVSNILKEFNRSIPSDIIHNKKWNLFLFNSYPLRPSFMLRYDGENIELI